MGGRGNFSGGTTRTTAQKIPETGTPYSRVVQYRNGKKHRERYYGADGRAKWDIDYSHGGDHEFPHKHTWDWSDPENPKRSKYEKNH